MIPIRLSLHNFMCYRDNTSPLDFSNIHTACLCGDNGSGKSALLDAITWALWGESRAGARNYDDLVHLGQTEMGVEFEFEVKCNHYRVIRQHSKPRKRGQPGQTLLKLQVRAPQGFRSISGNSLRETQQKIVDILHLDYETFVNSAFLRQGRADEFTLKSPVERKKVLADILGLSIYEELERDAKELARQKKEEETLWGKTIAQMEEEISLKPGYEAEWQRVREQLMVVEKEVESQKARVLALEREKKALEVKKEQLAELERNIQKAGNELRRWQNQLEEHSRKVEEYQQVLQERREVEEGYAALSQARGEYEECNRKARRRSSLLEHQSELQRKQDAARGELIAEQRARQRKVADLETRSQKKAELERELDQVRAELSQLSHLDGELKRKRQLAETLALHIHQLKMAEEQDMAEVRGLRDKLALLEQGEARCPLCDTELGINGIQRVEEKYQAEVRARVELEQQKREERIEKEMDRQSLEKEILQLDSRVRAVEARGERARNLEERIKEAVKAAEELTKTRTELTEIARRLTEGDFALEEQGALEEVKRQLEGLGYDAGRHQEVEQRCRELERFEPLKRRLEEADKFVLTEKTAVAQAREAIAHWSVDVERYRQNALSLKAESAALPELERRLGEAELIYQQWQQRQAEGQRALGAVEQKLERCAELERTLQERKRTKQEIERDRDMYEELSRAFGKDGIQAFIIESVLPELEREADKLLSRMTDGRMHLRLESQKALKSREGEVRETLDIIISDELGTRNYEMFSGGESFRINFALRVALSKLLARRAGAPLPTLIIDEGFGTQDRMGLDRLVEAIKSIEEDFEKIIVTTHIEELKDAFPVRIEVTKTTSGSLVTVS